MAVIKPVRLAGLSDVGRLLSGSGVSHQWPPPDCIALPAAVGVAWPGIVSTNGFRSLNPGWWYVTTVANLALELGVTVSDLLDRVVIGIFLPELALVFGAIDQWPVILEADGETMRWLHVTTKGVLLPDEQFQFGMDFGNPGADPNLDEAAQMALATALAPLYATAITSHGSLFGTVSTRFVEIGVSQHTQTAATNADGTGGAGSADPTQWVLFAAPIGGASPSPQALPYEVACAVTLQTAKRGARGRGRVYLPPFSIGAMGNQGRFSSGTVDGAGLLISEIIQAVESATTYKSIVVSKRGLELNLVTSINTGDVPDSQRRRRRSQVEVRTAGWARP